MKTKQPVCIFKNGREFPGWLYAQIIKKYGYDMALQILFKARDKDNPVGYCKKGMKEGWLATMTLEMERQKPYMMAWIATNVKRQKPEPKPKAQKPEKQYKIVAGKKYLVKKEAKMPDKMSDILKGMV